MSNFTDRYKAGCFLKDPQTFLYPLQVPDSNASTGNFLLVPDRTFTPNVPPGGTCFNQCPIRDRKAQQYPGGIVAHFFE